MKHFSLFIKRAFDIVSSGILIILLTPLWIVIAIAIKKDSEGPVFFKQGRRTKDGRVFQMLKFRSMVVNAEKMGAGLFNYENDPRVTKVGRKLRDSRLDELPQLFNILKGDMTLVGPRPERPEIEDVYLKEIPEFGMRLKVKAGLTGYAQVFGKYNTSPEDKLKLDLLYINQRSLLLDFKLIFYTIKIIFIPEATEGIEENKTTAGSK